MIRSRSILVVAAACAAALLASPSTSRAITTADGQTWTSEPDAWTRGNNADASHFGWDVLEQGASPTLGFGRILDDATPDLGGATTAASTRYYQGANGIADPAPTTYGHRSGSTNYYSGFGAGDLANDAIAATAPASGAGGFTTVVLQVIGGPPAATGANPIDDLSFQMTAGAWTLQKELYGTLASGTGLHWQEWTAPGANLNFTIRMTSTQSSRSIDAVQIDTYWSPAGPIVNARTSIGVPEPTTALAASLAFLPFTARRRAR